MGGRWCNIAVLNVPAPNEKSGDPKDSLHEKLERVFYHFSKYDMKILSEILMQKWRDTVLLYRQFGMRVYIRIVMVMVLLDRRWHSSVVDARSIRGADCDTDHNLVVAKLGEGYL